MAVAGGVIKVADIHIELIGTLRVTEGGHEVELPRSRKARALLAMLALEPREHARSALCAYLWPDTADPRADLRWSLSKLRAVLGTDAIVSSASGVRLDLEQVSTDVGRIQALLETAREGVVDDADLSLHQQRFSSTPLPDLDGRIGVEFELWLESQRQALRRLQQRLLAALVDGLAHDPPKALDLARRRLALDPLNEPACVDLLRLTLEAAGRRQAQAVLEQCRERLQEAGLSDAGLLAEWLRVSRASAQPAAAVSVQENATQTPSQPQVYMPPQKPSVAILSFERGGDDALLADGLSLDLTAQLARLNGLFVIARGSASRFRLADARPAEIGARLGVRYLVHGHVSHLDKRLRVTVELVECERGEQIWSERFERSMDDLFLVQDEIVNAIVSTLVPQIEQAERARARLLPTANLNAWECFHRAMWHTYRFTETDTLEARRLLERALEQDAGFARAHAGLSFNYFARVFLDASDDVNGDLERALEAGRESVSLEPRDALGHWSLGRALFLAREHDQALAAIDRSLIANPNYAQGFYARGYVGSHSGLARDVGHDLDMAQRLSPFDPMVFAMEAARAIALTVSGRAEEAVRWALRATQEPNAHFHIYAIAAATLQHAGQPAEAARHVREAERRHPGYSIDVFERSFPHKSEHDRKVMSEALAAAGLKQS